MAAGDDHSTQHELAVVWLASEDGLVAFLASCLLVPKSVMHAFCLKMAPGGSWTPDASENKAPGCCGSAAAGQEEICKPQAGFGNSAGSEPACLVGALLSPGRLVSTVLQILAKAVPDGWQKIHVCSAELLVVVVWTSVAQTADL